MRLGILDIGSNTVHLLVVDAARGAAPVPVHSSKRVLRLVDAVGEDGALVTSAVDELVRAVNTAIDTAERYGCRETMVCATSVLREVTNVDAIRTRIADETGVGLRVLSGLDEARLIFLAARRWFGWSAGNLLVVDIGGGSLEYALGRAEEPALAGSLPLGAARITRTRFTHDPPTRSELVSTATWLEDRLGEVAETLAGDGPPDRVVVTSKTFRSLTRLAEGLSPSCVDAGRVLTDPALAKLMTFISRLPAHDLAELEGVSQSRAHQLMAGALVAQSLMRVLSFPVLQTCPWALREGAILRRRDQIDGVEQTALSTGQDWHG